MNHATSKINESSSSAGLINPHTGHFSPIRHDRSIHAHHSHTNSDDSDEDDSQRHVFMEDVEIKPDPLSLDMIKGRFKGQSFKGQHSFYSPSKIYSHDDYEYEDNENKQIGISGGDEDAGGEFPKSITRRKGGRLRDPVWNSFHNIGDHTWQCNYCPYSLVRPQADRMRTHRRTKCLNLADHVSGGEVKADIGDGNANASSTSISASASATSTKTFPISKTPRDTVEGLYNFKTNSLTRQLKRIADALEESNKLKKLKLGLDPHIPFDGCVGPSK